MQTVESQAGQTDAHATQLAKSIASYRRLVSASFVPLEVTAQEAGSFLARLTSTSADDIVFTEVAAHPHLVERTTETIDAGGNGYYKVSLLLAGSSILVQDGKELVMRPGDLSVYDTSRPYSLLFGEEFRNLIMMFPKDRLEFPIPCTEELAAVSLSQEQPELAPILTAMLAQFPAQLVPLDGRVRTRVAHTAMDLFSTMVSSILDTQPEQRDPHQVLLKRITSHIDQHLSATDLTPSSIAGAHFISTRHLHALFRQAGTTVSTWVRERRLERCRAELLDPARNERTVAAIAASWGFSDAAHFSRVFKATYGIPPSELRHA